MRKEMTNSSSQRCLACFSSNPSIIYSINITQERTCMSSSNLRPITETPVVSTWIGWVVVVLFPVVGGGAWRDDASKPWHRFIPVAKT